MKRFVKFIFKSVGVIFLLFVGLMIVLIIFTPKEVIEKRIAEDKATAISLSLTQTAEPTKTPKPTFTITSTPEPTFTETETPIPTNTIVPVKNTPTSTPKALSKEEKLLKHKEYLTILCITKFWSLDSQSINYNAITLFDISEKPYPNIEVGAFIIEDKTTQKLYALGCGTLKTEDKTIVTALSLDGKLIFPN